MTEAKSNGHAGGNGKPAPQPITTHEALETVRRVPIEMLLEHPKNLHRDCEELVPSIAEDGIHDPLICRPILGQLQILCGHRRYSAAKLAKLSHVPVRVVELDDLAALRLLHRDNGQRKDLSPIQRAQALEDLTAAGMTVTAAADEAGISRPEASNLLRLLKLPPAFQQRVAAGEVPQTFARDWLLPVGDDPAAVGEVDKWIAAEIEEHGDLSMSREDFGRSVLQALDNAWESIEENYYCDRGRLSRDDVEKLDAETQAKLGLREIPSPWGGEAYQYATNAACYKELQKEKQAASATAAKTPAKEAKPKAKETAAQQRAREAKRAKQLAGNLDAWVDRLLRWQLAEVLTAKAGSPGAMRVRNAAAFRLLLWRASQKPANWKREQDVGDAIANGGKRSASCWPRIAELPIEDFPAVARRLLHPQLIDHPLEREVRDALCETLGVTRETAWRAAAICGEGMVLIDEWLALHTKSELIEIAAGWGVEAAASIKAADLLERLGQHLEQQGESIDLPAELAEKVARKGAKARRKK